MEREKFGSRLGFILISAGCAIGLGNVYRFPITTGSYGGAFFVLIYIAFLLLLGIPVMTAELSVGRGSQKSIAGSFNALEKPGQKWAFHEIRRHRRKLSSYDVLHDHLRLDAYLFLQVLNRLDHDGGRPWRCVRGSRFKSRTHDRGDFCGNTDLLRDLFDRPSEGR